MTQQEHSTKGVIATLCLLVHLISSLLIFLKLHHQYDISIALSLFVGFVYFIYCMYLLATLLCEISSEITYTVLTHML